MSVIVAKILVMFTDFTDRSDSHMEKRKKGTLSAMYLFLLDQGTALVKTSLSMRSKC